MPTDAQILGQIKAMHSRAQTTAAKKNMEQEQIELVPAVQSPASLEELAKQIEKEIAQQRPKGEAL